MTILLKRGLRGQKEATTEILNSKEFELSVADLYKWVATTPNISEGGYSVSVSDKSTYLALAEKLYAKHEEAGLIPGLRDMSSVW